MCNPDALKPEVQTVLRVFPALEAETMLKLEKQFDLWQHTDLPPDQCGLKQRLQVVGWWFFEKPTMIPSLYF